MRKAPTVRQVGFTAVELLITLSVLLFVIGISVSAINYGDRATKNTATDVLNALTAIETAFNTYQLDKGAFPSGMADSTFVPSYIFTPKPADGFDAYSLANSSGKYYICATTSGAATAADVPYKALTTIASKVSVDKFFVSNICGATSAVAPTGSSAMSGTYWLNR